MGKFLLSETVRKKKAILSQPRCPRNIKWQLCKGEQKQLFLIIGSFPLGYLVSVNEVERPCSYSTAGDPYLLVNPSEEIS